MSNDGANQPARRGVLKLLTVASGAALSGTVLVPAARVVLAPLEHGSTVDSGKWVKTVRFEALPEGQPKRVAIIADRKDAWSLEKNVELGSVWLLRQGDRVHALSAVCPHLGCLIQAEPTGGFACPCHDSSFETDGKRRSGPSPRDLDPLATRVQDGHVYVDYRAFRQGIPDRVEVG